MKAFHFKVLISLLTGIVYMNVVVAQHETTAPINKKEFSHVQLSKNDENMVLKVADSISKIRVAHMDSNDDMPGSKGIAETPERVPGLTLNNNEPVVYVLNTPGHEFVISQSRLNHVVEADWIKRLKINTSPEILKKYEAWKPGSVVFLELRSENLKEALSRLEKIKK